MSNFEETLLGLLVRIAMALEQSNEYARLQYEMNIDTAAATNALTTDVSGMVSKLLGGSDE